MKVIRVGKSNHRVTLGKIYNVYGTDKDTPHYISGNTNLYIIDKKNNKLAFSDNKDYWLELKEDHLYYSIYGGDVIFNQQEIDKYFPIGELFKHSVSQILKDKLHKKHKIEKKEINKMLNIKHKIMIDSVDSEDISIDTLLTMIADEEAQIKRVVDLKSTSKTLDALVNKYKENINKLIIILDTKSKNV